MNHTWSIAGASEMGRQHRLLGRNRQDAFAFEQRGSSVVLAVSDGCGSASHSEVGAYLGVHAAVRALLDGRDVAQAVRALIVPELADDAFLFTLVAAHISPAGVDAFIFGDGVIVVDDEIVAVHEDAPAYLAYGAAPVIARHWDRASRVAVATDGCIDLDLVSLSKNPRHYSHPDALRRTLAKAACLDDATLVLASSVWGDQ